MRLALRLASPVVALFAVSGQAPTDRPAYDVASVKLNTTDSGHTGTDDTQGTVMFENMPLQRLIAQAYQVPPFQVTGPDWIQTTRFDIVAKYGANVKNDARLLMLRTLLEDRFHLAVHRETKEASGYAMVVAKGGFKLKPVENASDSTDHTGGRRIQSLDAKGASMDRLASLVARYLGVAVANESKLEGFYDFHFRWTTDDQTASSSETENIPTLPAALEETLGLHLQPRKVPIEYVVIDHVDRTPVEN